MTLVKMLIFEKNGMNSRIVILMGTISMCFTSCSVQYRSTTFDDATTSISYHNKTNWAVYAGKKSDGKNIGVPSDTLQADVFYVYPTLLTDKKDVRWNAPIGDSLFNADVQNTAVAYQATAWATAARLFVPYYRQNHYRAFFEPYLKQGGLDAQELAYKDVKAAFQYYLVHENKKRPILLAGHSQGAHHLKKILHEFFDKKPLQKQLVAAYLVGTKVSPNAFNSIKPLTSADATGGFVSWNSYKMGKSPKYKSWYYGAVTTNPITWDTLKSSTYSQHKGLFYYDKKVYPKSLEVEVKDGLLWVSLPKVPKRFWLSFIRDYHNFDVNLFWQDISENAAIRVRSFLENSYK